MKKINNNQVQYAAITLIAIALLFSSTTAIAQKVRIGIKDATFAKALVERLASEYNKVETGVQFEVVPTNDADAIVQLTDNDIASVGKFVVLPIANSQNEILTNKKLRKGVNDKVEKKIFVQPTFEEALDAEEDEEKPLPGTVYSLSGSKAYITQLFADKLHTTPSQFKGKKVVGREENIISVVKQHNDAISFNVANLIYDLSSRQPQQGISVLTIDLDGNGKVSDEERAAITTIDALNDYVSHLAKPHTPVGNIVISSDNQKVKDFVAWAQTQGQDIVASQGFLKVPSLLGRAEGEALTAQR